MDETSLDAEALMALVERQEARIAELEAEIRECGDQEVGEVIEEMSHDIDGKIDRIQKLEEALKVFAEYGDRLAALNMPAEAAVGLYPETLRRVTLMAGDFMKARAALGGEA